MRCFCIRKHRPAVFKIRILAAIGTQLREGLFHIERGGFALGLHILRNGFRSDVVHAAIHNITQQRQGLIEGFVQAQCEGFPFHETQYSGIGRDVNIGF